MRYEGHHVESRCGGYREGHMTAVCKFGKTAFSFSDPYTWNDLQCTVMPVGQFKTQSSQHVTFF